ncbi:ABC transporter substrate-binding protein [Sulfobacillus harzensis]|uniref:Extracellular solute-binding protein n=1 Tax=Sulfobacillus harzensis TaxID=2729629 RepID=A0A7Y0L9B1_9FIRM|nr:extracellular solute-binding protein [Sulfobacillus harzensis]NMP24885.1 extracellular solute-binding protein [Sulfobacillus harzensis]
MNVGNGLMLMAGTALFAGILAGCGAQPSTSAGAASGGMTLWNVDSGTAEQVDNETISAWNKAHPNDTIQASYIESNPYLEKLQIAMGSSNRPDIWTNDIWTNWGGGRLKTYINAGDVLNLTPYLKADPSWGNKFLPSIMKSVTFEGKIYGVPHGNIQPVNFFYNKALFKQYHVSPPATWNQLLQDIRIFKSHGVIPIALGGADNWPDLMYFEYLVDRIGGPTVYKSISAGTPNSWSNPVVTQALDRMKQLVNMGAFENGFSSVGSNNGEDAALLYTGKAAMWLMGAWGYGSIEGSDSSFLPKLGWFPFPSVPGGKGNPADVAGNPANFFSISAKSPHKTAAIEYLKQYNLNSTNIKNLINIGYVPPVKGIGSELAHAKNGAYEQFYYNLAVKAPYFQQSWDTALPTVEGNELDTDLGKFMVGQMSVQQFEADMNAHLQK